MPQQATGLQGQGTEEDKAAVLAQREAKKAAKAAKKMAAKSKDTEDVPPPETTTSSAAAAPVPSDAPAASSEPPHTGLRGQSTEEDKAAVQAQREAKKAAKAAKKAGKKPAAEAADAQPEETAPAAPAPAPAAKVEAAKPKASKAPPPLFAPAPMEHAAPDVVPVPSPYVAPPPVPDTTDLHPRVVELGLLFRSQRVVGGNARAFAMLSAMRDVIQSSPALATLHSLRTQEAELICKVVQRNCDHLALCREPSVGMAYLIKLLKERITMASQLPDSGKRDARECAQAHVKDLCEETLQAVRDLSDKGRRNIAADDLILVFGRSAAIEQMLLDKARMDRTDFKVCIVDSAPLYEGRGLLWKLQQARIHCLYVLLPSVCAVMPRATKVFIGASAVLQSGEVMSRAGTAMVSLVAKRFRKPVLCFCESYKFTDKVWMGSLTMNQTTGASPAGRAGQGLMYDLTPVQFVDVVISEVSTMHPSAVAAAIRDRNERDSKLPS